MTRDPETAWTYQPELFPETAPIGGPTDIGREDTPPALAPVRRTPGWVLVGSTRGSRGYHRVRTASQNGSLLTICGVVGRKIPDEATTIQPCSICEAS